MIKYPNDRHNGFVLLADGNNQPYVFDCPYPDYGTEEGRAMKFAGAYLLLTKRLSYDKE